MLLCPFCNFMFFLSRNISKSHFYNAAKTNIQINSANILHPRGSCLVLVRSRESKFNFILTKQLAQTLATGRPDTSIQSLRLSLSTRSSSQWLPASSNRASSACQWTTRMILAMEASTKSQRYGTTTLTCIHLANLQRWQLLQPHLPNYLKMPVVPTYSRSPSRIKTQPAR